MYYAYYNLTENPFAITPDPRYLYMSKQHEEALAHLAYGAEQGGGFIQLTGEVGTGKTTLTRALLEQLPQDLELALLFNPQQTALEFVRSICDELHIEYPAENRNSLKDLVDVLNVRLLENHRQGIRTAVMIDEAQNLEVDVLEQIRLLTNLETAKQKLLMVILVGQPELRVLLARKELRQLSQRITARYHLMPLTLTDSREYIRHRMEVAGCDVAVFSPQAIQLIHKAANGVPRLINVFCDRALLGAFTQEKHRVDGSTARKAIKEIQGDLPTENPRLSFTPWASAALAATLVAVTIGLIYTQFMDKPGLLAQAEIDIPESKPARIETVSSIPEQAKIETLSPVSEPGNTAPAQQPSDAMKAIDTPVPENNLAQFLNTADLASDTNSAFRKVFALWSEDYLRIQGDSACERAAVVGLNCLFSKGTWNNLREFNRPAIIELLDQEQNRHHMVVFRLTDTHVSFMVGEDEHTFATHEVEPFWYGEYLLLWRQPPVNEAILKPGTVGTSAQWLSETLDQIEGKTSMQEPQLVFDGELERRVKNFQRRNRLTADGVVGQQTLIRLTSAVDDPSTPSLLQ